MVKEQIQVLLYRTDSCIWCHKAMEWLKAHKIKFTEKKVDHDDKAAEEMIEKSPPYQLFPQTSSAYLLYENSEYFVAEAKKNKPKLGGKKKSKGIDLTQPIKNCTRINFFLIPKLI